MAFGERINNPLNLRDFGTKWPGYVGPYKTPGNGTFARFDSPVSGYRAAFKNMRWIAQKKGARTIGQLINVWAPPADNNNTSAYVQRVAQMSGLNPNEPIPFNDPQKMVQLAKAMTAVELGKNPYSDETIQTAYTGAFKSAPEPTRSPWSEGLRAAVPLPGETDTSLPTTRIPPSITSPSAKDANVATPNQPNRLDPAVMTGLALANSGQTKMSDLNRALIADALQGRVEHPVDAIGRIAQVAAAHYSQSRKDKAQREALAKAVATGNPAALIGLPGPAGKIGMAHYASDLAAKRDAAKREADFNDKKRLITDPDVIKAKKETRGPLVNISPGEKAITGIDAGRLKKFYTDADTANSSLSQLTRLQPMLKGINTGAFAKQGLTLGQIGKRLGVEIPGGMDPNQVPTAEAANAMIQQMIVPMVKQLGANPTDADARRIEAALPSLTTSPEGNRLLMKMLTETARDKIGRASRARKWFSSHNSSLEGFEEAELKRSEALAMKHQKRIEALSGQAKGWKIERVE